MTSDQSPLALAEFSPRPTLALHAHPVSAPRFPVVDAHNHLGASFPALQDRSTEELIEVLDVSGVDLVVDLDGGQGSSLSAEVARWGPSGRVLVFAGLDYEMWSANADFGAVEAARLRDSASRGARGLKVWKTLGLRARDTQGRLVGVDDERLNPLFETAAELGFPVVIHVGDPFAFFQPLDRFNERYEELESNPDWHFWPTSAAANPKPGTFPVLRTIHAGLSELVARHPAVSFVAAHVASSAEDLGFVADLLERHANLSVDFAERINELGRQPYTAREFFLRFPDRILFGLDRPLETEYYRRYYRFLETFDESFDYGIEDVPRQGRWQIHGLGLPDDVLRAIYGENARRILGTSR